MLVGEISVRALSGFQMDIFFFNVNVGWMQTLLQKTYKLKFNKIVID